MLICTQITLLCCITINETGKLQQYVHPMLIYICKLPCITVSSATNFFYNNSMSSRFYRYKGIFQAHYLVNIKIMSGTILPFFPLFNLDIQKLEINLLQDILVLFRYFLWTYIFSSRGSGHNTKPLWFTLIIVSPESEPAVCPHEQQHPGLYHK